MWDDIRGGQWNLLHDAVRILSLDADSQLESIGAAHPDELGLDFDDGYLLVPALVESGVGLSDRLLALLAEIDARLSAMSGHRNASLWTMDGIRTRPEWADIRALAAEALSLFPSPP